ncbi:MAG: ABC transporter ATP-binding protein [Thiothrix sp.]|nr:ABC transporter ATP-binding protein [Thiothrix sp.]HPQ96851.1 ABC transporter ATP-binding protein [Thiolinea sp.]
MIEFINVSKYYPLRRGYRVIMDRVSFRFPEHRNIGILGRNGAGKSTLLRMIAGSVPLDGGRIRRIGRFSWPLGFSGGFNANLSGEENLRFIVRIYDADLRQVTDYVREFSELGDAMKEPLKSYSSGMRARLAFGLCLAMDFDVYLIDEVMAVGDPSFKKKSKAAFDERRQRANIILVSHNMNTIREYADVIIMLHEQKLIVYEDLDQGIRAYKRLSGGDENDPT